MVPPTHRDCKPGLALAGTGLSRAHAVLHKQPRLKRLRRQCSTLALYVALIMSDEQPDEQQFKSNTRPSLLPRVLCVGPRGDFSQGSVFSVF